MRFSSFRPGSPRGRVGAMKIRLALVSSLLLPAAIAAAEPVAYELLEGSQAHVVCMFCRIRPILIGGSFLLTLEQDTPPFTGYEIDEVEFHSTQVGDDWGLSGAGTYVRFEEVAVTEEM